MPSSVPAALPPRRWRRWRLAVGLAASLALAAPAAGRAEEAASAITVPVEALAAAVAAWLAAERGMDAVPALPRIRRTPPATLAALYRSAAEDGAQGAGGVSALYDRERRTIHLPTGWTGRDAAEISVLVHEMAHHFQHVTGERFGCPAEREGAAYGLQARWLALFGQDLHAAVGVDPLALRLLAVCGF